ncbi:MAG: TolC family protein [Pseudomonadales bacterium]
MTRRNVALVLSFGGLACMVQSAVGAEPAPNLSPPPALSAFVESVVDENPQVRAARAALEATVAFESAAARPLYNPEVGIQAENAESDTRAIGISQTIDWGNKRSARTAVAESERLAAQAEYRAVRWDIMTELLGGLAFHQTGADRDALAQTRAELMHDFANLAQRRFEAGDLTQVDLDLALLAFTEARIERATAAAQLAAARQAVRNITPRSEPAAWPPLPAELPALPVEQLSLEEMVLALPEVQAARRRANAAADLVELRRREQRPDPTVSLSGGQEGGKNLVGLTLSMPLYIRNRFRYEVEAAAAEHDRSQRLADDVLQRTYARLVSAAERYRLSNAAWDDWERTGQVSVERQSDLLRRLWEAGELSTTDYLVQLRQTLDVRDSALDLRFALWEAWFEWLQASGRLDAWLGVTP